MKKILKWFLIILGLFIIILVAIPFLFKDKIVAKIKEETNKSINAKVDFGDFDLSLLRSFPDLSMRINNLSVINLAPFEGDTLVYARQIDLDINLMSVISGDQIKINSIALDKPVMYFLVNKDGKPNWDIAKPSSEPQKASEPSKFKASLKEYTVTDGFIVYQDLTMPFYLKLAGVNHSGSGDFTQDLFVLSTKTNAQTVDLSYGGIKYISNAHALADADIDMDMKNFKFTFKNNKIQLNELNIGFGGYVMMPDSNIDMDLKFSAAQTEFKNFVSIVPAVYSPQFKELKASGTMALEGFIKGRYNAVMMPGFGLSLKIGNGMFRYPTLPSSVDNVNVDLAINNPDGIPDHTLINLSKFHVEMNHDPFDARLVLKTPVSDPDLDMFLKGRVDLSGIGKFVPLEKGTDLSGVITADLTAKGRMSAIQQKKFEQFSAAGNFGITGMKYSSASMKEPVMINTLKLGFTPAKVSLDAFNAKIGASDFNATGSLENFIAYALKNETISGTLNFNSSVTDLNQFMSSENTASGQTDTASMSVLDVPSNVNFVLNAAIGKLVYQDLTIGNVQGKLEIRNKTISMKDVFMQLMGGSMTMNGSYSSVNPKKPGFTFGLDIKNFDISQTVKSFPTVAKMAPIAKNCTGTYSTNMSVLGDLDTKMMPVMNSLTGSGKLTTGKVVVDNFPAFAKIADVLKMDSWKRFELPTVSPSFKFANGRVYVDPFDMTVNGIKSTVAGSNGFDQTIDYTMASQIPRSALGAGANSFVNGLLSSANSKGANISVGDVIPVNIHITGTVTSPKVGTDLNKAGAKAMDDLKAKAQEEFDKKKAEAEAKAKAEADRIKKEAEDKAKAEADRLKKEAEAKAKAEADRLKKEAEQKAKDQIKNIFKK